MQVLQVKPASGANMPIQLVYYAKLASESTFQVLKIQKFLGGAAPLTPGFSWTSSKELTPGLAWKHMVRNNSRK